MVKARTGRAPRRFVAAALLLAACARNPRAPQDAGAIVPPPPEPELPSEVRELNWTVISPDGQTQLTQTATFVNDCRVTCARGSLTLWSSRKCLGKTLDFRFVGDDGERVVVVHPLPNAHDWRGAAVAHVYVRDRLLYPVAAATVVKQKQLVRTAGMTVYWLQGAADIPGQPPRYTADGAGVTFTAVDGTPSTIPLVDAHQ